MRALHPAKIAASVILLLGAVASTAGLMGTSGLMGNGTGLLGLGTTTTVKPTTTTAKPATTTTSTSTTATPPPDPTTTVAGSPVTAIAANQAIGVQTGDYLLTASGVTAPSSTYGSVMQLLGGAGLPDRNADFLATPTPQTVTAEVRVTGPSDQFELTGSSVTFDSMTLTPASWSYLVRGPYVTSTTSNQVIWHGVNGGVDMNPATDYANLIHTYPKDTIVRIDVDEECWDPFFTTAQTSAHCALPSPTPSGWQNYQARIEQAVAAVISLGDVVDIGVCDAGQDTPTWLASSDAYEFGADQQTLVVEQQLAQLWANNPQVVLETMNEPLMVPSDPYPPNNTTGTTLWYSGGEVNQGANTWDMPGVQQQVDTIRATGANNMILVEGTWWGHDLVLVETDPVAGTNLMYSYHAYPDKSSSTTCTAALAWEVAPIINPAGSWRYAAMMTEFDTQMSDAVGGGSDYLQSCINFAKQYSSNWAAWGWFPNGYDTWGLLNSWDPLSLTSRAKTVVKNF